LLWDIFRVNERCEEATRQHQGGKQIGGLKIAREAAAIVDSYYSRPSLEGVARRHLARLGIDASICLRKCGAADESVRLLERQTKLLREWAQQEPGSDTVFADLSQSWEQVGKAQWELNRPEAALDADRQALLAQQRAYTLAPGDAEYRRDLDTRYAHLGRKLCELGRLDEAESLFREQQALSTTNFGEHVEALREVRKWADQIGSKGTDLSPARRQERQRYLELAERLERRSPYGDETKDGAKR
jgi:tetratricopeptide (TPR) repeat protein